MATRTSGPVVWYGGKGRFTKWLLPLVPSTSIYVEPYGGAASLLFAREPAKVEVYNDLDGRLVNLFRALQDPRRRRRLEQRVRCTFYSRAEFDRALDVLRQSSPDADDLAWAFFVAQNQSYGGIAQTTGNWGRAKRAPAKRTSAWWSRVDAIEFWASRLSGVQIEQRDALDVIRFWDHEDAVFYLDPPYVHATRDANCRSVYAAEPSDDHHEQLVATLLAARGACVLSGYATGLYEPLERAGWRRIDQSVTCKWRSTTAQARVETVWLNERALELGNPSE